MYPEYGRRKCNLRFFESSEFVDHAIRHGITCGIAERRLIWKLCR